MKTAIVTGASSGIGKELALLLLKSGCRVGLIARRADLLHDIAKDFPSQDTVILPADLRVPDSALKSLMSLWHQLGQVDYVFLNAGVSLNHELFSWQNDRDVIQVNVSAFTAMAGESARCFLRQGFGHLIGISSIAGVRGSGKAPVYGATKAFVSNYLQGLRQQVRAINPSVSITDVRPGFVETAMIQDVPVKFWVCSPRKAALQIWQAVLRKKRMVYVSRRWRMLAVLYRLLPEFLLERIYARFLQRSS